MVKNYMQNVMERRKDKCRGYWIS